jgi:epoxyqueuosine reductase
MEQAQSFDTALLDNAGLNRQAVFNIDDLPEDLAASVRAACADASAFRQLILIGHAGRTLWESVKSSGIESEHPIDEFTVQTVKRWCAQNHPENAYDLIYPGTEAVGLQRLGQLAGWHHATPFMVGIDGKWGTWYAYRAVVLADTAFTPTRPLAGARFDFGKCIGYRKEAGSGCKATCLARLSCPVGETHRYCDEQIHHTYSLSMRAIERYC